MRSVVSSPSGQLRNGHPLNFSGHLFQWLLNCEVWIVSRGIGWLRLLWLWWLGWRRRLWRLWRSRLRGGRLWLCWFSSSGRCKYVRLSLWLQQQLFVQLVLGHLWNVAKHVGARCVCLLCSFRCKTIQRFSHALCRAAVIGKHVQHFERVGVCTKHALLCVVLELLASPACIDGHLCSIKYRSPYVVVASTLKRSHL